MRRLLPLVLVAMLLGLVMVPGILVFGLTALAQRSDAAQAEALRAQEEAERAREEAIRAEADAAREREAFKSPERLKMERRELEPLRAELQERVARSLAEGNREAAESAERRLQEIVTVIRELDARIEEASRQGRPLELREAEERMRDLRAQMAHGPQPREPGDRIRHLREAAGHLEAAGLHDQAHDLFAQADRLEHEGGPAMMEVHRQLAELREQVELLRREVHELGEIVGDLRRQR